MAEIEAVVFDLGNVLIRWDPRRLYRQMFSSDDAAMEHFLTNICTMDWNERHDAGRPIAEGTAELVAKFPAKESHIRAYYDLWEEMLGGAIEENVRILETLKTQGMPVFALSNWSAETFPRARPRFPFLDLFDGIVLSGAEGVIKPDPRIFEILFARYDLKPQNALFIDDSAKNISAAQRFGMTCVHFTEDVDLEAELTKLGVLVL